MGVGIMNAPEIWYMGYGLNVIVTFLSGNMLTAVLMFVCIAGLAYSERTE